MTRAMAAVRAASCTRRRTRCGSLLGRPSAQSGAPGTSRPSTIVAVSVPGGTSVAWNAPAGSE
jgi:hypothetical protein